MLLSAIDGVKHCNRYKPASTLFYSLSLFSVSLVSAVRALTVLAICHGRSCVMTTACFILGCLQTAYPFTVPGAAVSIRVQRSMEKSRPLFFSRGSANVLDKPCMKRKLLNPEAIDVALRQRALVVENGIFHAQPRWIKTLSIAGYLYPYFYASPHLRSLVHCSKLLVVMLRLSQNLAVGT